MFPKYAEVEEPLLIEIDRRGGKVRPARDRDQFNKNIYESLADYFALSEEERNAQIDNKGKKESEWQNRVRWARNRLREKKLIDPSEWGVWAITNEGRAFLRQQQLDQPSRGMLPRNALISPNDFQKLQQRAQEIGNLGENIVLEYERNILRAAGRDDLAAKINHVAQVDVSAGFDILSFSINGAKKYIEVKTTVTNYETFDITSNEWETAERYGSQYWIYHVRNAEDSSPTIDKLQDPFSLALANKLILRPTSFRVIPSDSQ